MAAFLAFLVVLLVVAISLLKSKQGSKEKFSSESGPAEVSYEPLSKMMLLAGKSKSPELLLEKEKDSNTNRRRRVSGRRM